MISIIYIQPRPSSKKDIHTIETSAAKRLTEGSVVVSLVVVVLWPFSSSTYTKIEACAKKAKKEAGPYFKKGHKTNWSLLFGDNVPEGGL